VPISVPSPVASLTNQRGKILTYTEPLFAPRPSEPAAAAIELRSVDKEFHTPGGGRHQALRELNLAVAAGEFCAVVGPTGSGKSTTLSSMEIGSRQRRRRAPLPR
jgi:ABC-type transport system involved in cytochrome bd biosynthesis fused ATPase/permease subunit